MVNAVVEAYIDEGGTHSGSWRVCVGAWYGERDAWSKFAEKWEPVLRNAKIDCFHAQEPRCDALRAPLCSLLRESAIKGFLGAMAQSAYTRAATAQLRSSLGNPYAICAFNIGLHIADAARRSAVGPVAFFIEDGQPNVRFVQRSLELFIGDDEWGVESVTVAKKRDFVPLQAADFLAHCGATRDVPWLEQLIGDGNGQALIADHGEKDLAAMSKEVQDVWREYRRLQRNDKARRRQQRRNE